MTGFAVTAMGASAVPLRRLNSSYTIRKCSGQPQLARFANSIMEKRTELVEFRLNRSYILDVTKAFMNA